MLTPIKPTTSQELSILETVVFNRPKGDDYLKQVYYRQQKVLLAGHIVGRPIMILGIKVASGLNKHIQKC